VGDLEPAHTFDSGNCSDVDTEDESGDAKMKTSDMETVKLKVKNLAMALLQIEQGIEAKFIGAPFGPSKELKDKDAMTRAIENGKKKVLRWEESLVKCTSYSQVSKTTKSNSSSIYLKFKFSICRFSYTTMFFTIRFNGRVRLRRLAARCVVAKTILSRRYCVTNVTKRGTCSA